MENPKERQPIAGIILIILAKEDRERVFTQLTTTFSVDTSYAGPISSLHTGEWAMIYLECEQGRAEKVVAWCESAQRVGLISRYHWAKVSEMHRSEEKHG